MIVWSDYQKYLLEECKKLLSAGKVYTDYEAEKEIAGMVRVMKYLTGSIDIPLIWKLTFSSKNSFMECRLLLAFCLMELFSEKEKTSWSQERLNSIERLFFNTETKPEYPHITCNLLPMNMIDAAEKKDLAKLTFLLDVSDDAEWHRKQLLALFVKKQDFDSICKLGLYDELESLKEYRIFALLFYVDAEKYPELFARMYQYINTGKFLRRAIKCGCLANYLPFLFSQEIITPDTVLFKSGPVKITLKQYYFFLCEIYPALKIFQKKLTENTQKEKISRYITVFHFQTSLPASYFVAQ